MEIFGIPIVIIIAFLFLTLCRYSEDQQKKKQEVAKKLDMVTTGMSKDEVLRILGKPHRVWQAGAAEIWVYGPTDSDGQIRFLNEKVIGYQKPS